MGNDAHGLERVPAGLSLAGDHPGMAIIISVLGFNLIGDGLREASTPSSVAERPLLSVEDLRVEFWTSRGNIYAVNGISFDIAAGETLGIVGESGCGKSVTSLAILGLLPRAGRTRTGRAMFDGRDLLKLRNRELRKVRGKEIAMIFQDPMTSLNPVLTIGRQLREPLEEHFGLGRKDAEKRAAELIDRVGIPSAKSRIRDYPHQFSGRMRQRAMIAMALACKPKLLIADEPTTALDVTIQAQILNLLRELVAEENAALILITHDLGVVAGMCERVNVMYRDCSWRRARPGSSSSTRDTRTRWACCSRSRLDAARKTKLHRFRATPATRWLRRPSACSSRGAATRSTSRARRSRRSSRSSPGTPSPASTRCPKRSGRGLQGGRRVVSQNGALVELQDSSSTSGSRADRPRPPRRRHQGRRRRLVRDSPRRDARPGRRIGLRQVDRGPRDPAPLRADRRQGLLRRPGHHAHRRGFRPLRRRMQMVFQDPFPP